MGGSELTLEFILELALAGLLVATLVQAIRLQRALSHLRGDRAAMEGAVAGFDNGARLAEAGLARLREATDDVAGRLSHAAELKDDLAMLADRGESLADRLDELVRAARLVPAAVPLPPASAAGPVSSSSAAPPPQPVRSQAERSLLAALQARR